MARADDGNVAPPQLTGSVAGMDHCGEGRDRLRVGMLYRVGDWVDGRFGYEHVVRK